MPEPSRETLAVLGQHLAGLDPAALRTSLDTLTALATDAERPGGPAAVLAFAYGLAAIRDGHPRHTLAGARLDGATCAAGASLHPAGSA